MASPAGNVFPAFILRGLRKICFFLKLYYSTVSLLQLMSYFAPKSRNERFCIRFQTKLCRIHVHDESIQDSKFRAKLSEITKVMGD